MRTMKNKLTRSGWPRTSNGFPQLQLLIGQTFKSTTLSSCLEPSGVVARCRATAGENGLVRDVNHQENLVHDEKQLRRSRLAHLGSTREAIIQLPRELVNSVQEIVRSVPQRSAIRTAALGLYSKYRLTSSKASLKADQHQLLNESVEKFTAMLKDDSHGARRGKYIRPKINTRYDHLTSISFAAGAMPSVYGATLRVLLEAERKLCFERIGDQKKWTPRVMLDFGSGTGASAWAALKVWPDSLKEYVGLDKSSSMNWLGQQLLSNHESSSLGHAALKAEFKRISICPAKVERKRYQSLTNQMNLSTSSEESAISLPEQQSLNAFTFLPPTTETEGLLAIMSFTLTDLPNRIARKEAVLKMWNSGAETMVVIDRGTPAGFEVVAEARQQLLMLGRRGSKTTSDKGKRYSPVDSSPSSPAIPHSGLQKMQVQAECDDGCRKTGSYVLAPCPHDHECPLHFSSDPKHFCHFSQRIERPKFLKDTKHTKKLEEDAKYCYVVIRRGQRPGLVSTSESNAENCELDQVMSEDEGSEARHLNQFKEVSLGWPRIILPPIKSTGHVILDTCTRSGQIERITIPKSQGKQEYYDARKSSWGDTWPHGSKKCGIVKKYKSKSLGQLLQEPSESQALV